MARPISVAPTVSPVELVTPVRAGIAMATATCTTTRTASKICRTRDRLSPLISEKASRPTVRAIEIPVMAARTPVLRS